MAEEHRCQAPRLCANNCGFFGSTATQNFCSKCYRDLELKEQQSSSAKLALNQSLVAAASSSISSPSPTSLTPSSSSSSSSSSSLSTIPASHPPLPGAVVPENQLDEIQAKAEAVSPAQPNRCVACRRRVGLTGFECKCGMTFCGSHRYPEGHGCTFDFKGKGREQIAKANPIVKAEKLEKI